MATPSPSETAQSLRDALAPYVRPRNEAAYIRRILKAHLTSSLQSDGNGDDLLDGRSLALVDVARDPKIRPEACGLQKDYLRALQANLEARRAFEQRAAAVKETARVGADAGASTDSRASETTGGAERSASAILQDHLVSVKLQRKQDRLQTVNRYLDALAERPVAVAAGEDYLLPEFIYGDATMTLPEIPQVVVDGLAAEEADRAAGAVERRGGGTAASTTSATSTAVQVATDLEGLVAQLEKSVLRAQLTLRQEEKLLAAARVRTARRPELTPALVPASAKLAALGATRDELIAWIETELSHTSHDDNNDDEDDEAAAAVAESSRMLRQSLLNGHGTEAGIGGSISNNASKAQLMEKLDGVRLKYAQYVDAREALVDTVGTMSPLNNDAPTTTAVSSALFANMPRLPPQSQTERQAAGGVSADSRPGDTTTAATTTATTTDGAVSQSATRAVALGHLILIPYLEQLLTVAREQKANIAHKAHYNVLLAKRLKDTCQMLDHLADESQLLPRYGPQGSQGIGARAGMGAGGRLLRPRDVLAGAPGTDSNPDGASRRVAEWIYAADAAKIATFEAVFEQIEEGQAALQTATEALDEAGLLLGRRLDDAAGEEDDKGKGRKPKAGKAGQDEAKAAAAAKRNECDIWASLNGELGLLKSGGRR